ncbi:protein kinase [Actinomadura sp. LD22]|uniref:Protein kinase n=1 Tax=Actinomadura physcomitrii TaxID=2650748 RepID=A0A6I4MBN2_9ACTN|nr:serine/threonine-protein kinase [Actinomadura physcomitrii]MWA01825.1 protein kinase [Actinomadura physcomitrii]
MASPLPLTAADPTRLGGYEILGRLGTGGQGVVYLGRPAGGAPSGAPPRVAVKLLHAQLLGNAAARGRFVRELALLQRVAGFCTAQVLAADMDGDRPYIVSEYVPGRSLRELVLEQGPRTGADLDRLAIGTVTALTAIHRAGVVHRDFKPQNVLMGLDGPRVIDFGIARAFDAGATMTSQVVGTPAYMAPEQFAGRVSPATDLFAWAATLLFAATGRDPFAGGALPAVMYRIMHEAPDLGALPGPIAEVAAACLAKDPKARPTSEDVLLRLLGDRPGPPHPRLEPSAAPGTEVPPEPPTTTWTGAARPDPAQPGAAQPGAAQTDGGRPGVGQSGAAWRGTAGAATGADANGSPPGAHGVAEAPTAAGFGTGPGSTEAAAPAAPRVRGLPGPDAETASALHPAPSGHPGHPPYPQPLNHQRPLWHQEPPAPQQPPGYASPVAGHGRPEHPAPRPARTYRRLRRGPGVVTGLVLAALLAALDVVVLAILIARPSLSSGHRAALLPVVAGSFTLVAVVTLVAVIVAWRGSRAAAWTVVAARIARVAMWAGWGALVHVDPAALAGHAALTALVVVLLAQGLWAS